MTRFVVVWMAMAVVFLFVQGLWNSAVVALDIQTWSAFLMAKARAISGGLDLTVPSRAVAIRMWQATAFEIFISCILNGILSFAIGGLFLRAAKNDNSRWFSASFGGFKCPLGVAWLYFRYAAQIALWSLLLVVPGIVAMYRYCQCWNLKVEHPDWSAGKCLSESARIMKGQKWNRFAFDCSYWKPITLVLLGFLGISVISAASAVSGSVPPVLRGVGMALTCACICGGLWLGVYISIGQALFYLEIADSPAKGVADSK